MQAKLAALLAVAALAVAGCGNQEGATPTNPTPTQAAVATSPAEPAYIEEEHAEATFERRFRHEYMEGKNQGFLRAASVRFRTPCHDEGAGQNGLLSWTCEGWGVEAVGGSENCFLVTATVNRNGIQGELQTATESPNEEAYNVCREGSKEGQPPGNLNAEGG